MTTETRPARRSRERDLRVDAVRGVALVSMYVAHCAPSTGPGHVLLLAQYATYPLFALLVGMGAALGARSPSTAWWVGPLVRGAVLIMMAEVLERLHAQIYIVLAFLGVLTWLAAPLARARPALVACVGAAALLVSPRLSTLGSSWVQEDFPGGLVTLHLARFLVSGGPATGGPYQIASMVFFAAVGILLTHVIFPALGARDGRRLALGAGCGIACVAWLGIEEVAPFEMHAYEITYTVLTFDALLIVAITLLVAGLAGLLPRFAVPLAAMGAMSLTLYSLQVAWLAYDVRVLHVGSLDNTWTNVAVLVGGSLALALVWRPAIRVDPWRRGPLEGPVAALVRALTPRTARG